MFGAMRHNESLGTCEGWDGQVWVVGAHQFYDAGKHLVDRRPNHQCSFAVFHLMQVGAHTRVPCFNVEGELACFCYFITVGCRFIITIRLAWHGQSRAGVICIDVPRQIARAFGCSHRSACFSARSKSLSGKSS